MMRKVTLLMVMTIVLTMAFGAGQPAQAISGTFTTLSFPNASASSCGTINVSGGLVTTSAAWTATFKAVDGRGRVVSSNTARGPGGANYSGWGTEYFTVAPLANPIRVTITINEGNGPVTYFDQSLDNPCVPAGGGGSTSYLGSSSAAGFVLHTIVCDVAVYDSPGGQPVANTLIRAGQTWFVNPKPVTTEAGESWTEISVSGVPNGYIPTRCVG
jgi:hypothetical protein